MSRVSAAEELCLSCGLCCNGVLFGDVRLQPGDDPARLKALGLKLRARGARLRFTQPCSALNAKCECGIYAGRPVYCRAFECALLQSVLAGETDQPAAARVIRSARQRAAKAARLLRALGNEDEHLPLGERFRATAKAFNAVPPDAEASARFSELTLAMHRLNLLLSQEFYPAGSE